MQALAKIKEVLSQRPSQYIATTMDFNEIDLEHLAQEWKLKEDGAERGSRGQPPADAQDLDSIETKIVNNFEAEKNRNYSTLLSELRAYDDRITALSLDNMVFEIKTAAHNAIAEFGVEVRDGVNQLELDLRHVKEIETERKAFRAEHGLTNRAAHHPESLVLNWGIIAVLFLIESVANASFLAVGLEGGLLGGFVEAVAIAALNVGVGVGVGKLVYPYVNHKRAAWNLFGWLFIGLHLAFTVAFNLVVAHYRVALGGDHPESASVVAIQSFLTAPFDIENFQSWMMVGIGILFAIIAAFDSFKMNDKYPGYSKLERRYRTALQDYSNHQADIMDELRHIKDDAIQEMHDLKQRLSARRAEFESILSHRGRLIKAFDQRIPYLQNCTRHLLSIYRDANIAARGKVKTPAYFNKPLIIEHPGKIETPARFATDQARLDSAVGSTTSELDMASDKMLAEFGSVQNRFPMLHELLDGVKA